MTQSNYDLIPFNVSILFFLVLQNKPLGHKNAVRKIKFNAYFHFYDNIKILN